MRVMVIIKSNTDSEAGIQPSAAELEAMGNYNEELIQAGIMLAGEGLTASKEGARVRFKPGSPEKKVIDGPFAESKELVAGFWIWKVDSIDEATDWVKKMPCIGTEESDVEIRRVAEFEDFGENMTPELRAQEDSQRERLGTTA